MNAPVSDREFRLACAEEGLRALLLRRDELTAELAGVNQALSTEGRAYADLLGEKLLPSVERLRRELLGDAQPSPGSRPPCPKK